jgi:hypothetical protein
MNHTHLHLRNPAIQLQPCCKKIDTVPSLDVACLRARVRDTFARGTSRTLGPRYDWRRKSLGTGTLRSTVTEKKSKYLRGDGQKRNHIGSLTAQGASTSLNIPAFEILLGFCSCCLAVKASASWWPISLHHQYRSFLGSKARSQAWPGQGARKHQRAHGKPVVLKILKQPRGVHNSASCYSLSKHPCVVSAHKLQNIRYADKFISSTVVCGKCEFARRLFGFPTSRKARESAEDVLDVD